MNEQTHPATGVEQERTPQQRMEAILMQSEDPALNEPKPEAEVAPQKEQPEGPAAEEVTSDDLEVEAESQAEQPSEVDAFEIVHDGTQVKLTRAEAIQYARQGFDYTKKTQALAEKTRQVDTYLQTFAQVDQVKPYLAQHERAVGALEAQLSQYQGVNWVQMANEDPVRYSQVRAQYDVLRDQHGQASQQYQHARVAVENKLAEVERNRLASEVQRLPELVPEWKDPAKRTQAESEIVKHYASNYGVNEQELRGHMRGAVSLAVAYKAMRYDQLVKSKAEKVKQLRTAPPMTVPGAKSGSAKADKDVELRNNLRKSGDARDAMAVLLNRMK